MYRLRISFLSLLAGLSGQSHAADLKLASWNLGWHLSQAEAKAWIAGCDANYALDQNKAWIKSGKTDAQKGWKIDWRPRDADIKLPWDIEAMPPCGIYQDENRNVIPVTLAAFKKRGQEIAKVIHDMSPDVIAFQEVSGVAAIKDVLGRSAGRYRVCSYPGYSVQRLAIAWKKNLGKSKGVCEVEEALSLPENGDNRRPRPGDGRYPVRSLIARPVPLNNPTPEADAMSVTLPDVASAAVLAQTVGPEVEVFGPDGRLLGRFTPAPRPGMMFPELGMTDEELERLENAPNAKWHTPDEVMARLRSLRKDA